MGEHTGNINTINSANLEFSTKILSLESNSSIYSTELKSITEKISRQSQYVQLIEVLEDKVNNIDEMQQRNEARIKTELQDSFSKRCEDLVLYMDARIEKYDADRKTERALIRKDADDLLKQMRTLKSSIVTLKISLLTSILINNKYPMS